MIIFTPNTLIKSSEVNANLDGLAQGTEINNDTILSRHMDIISTTDANGWKVYDFGSMKHYFKRVTFSQSIGASAFLTTSSSNMPVGVSNFQNRYFMYSYSTDANAYGLNMVLERQDTATSISYTVGSIDGATRTYTGWIDQYFIGA